MSIVNKLGSDNTEMLSVFQTQQEKEDKIDIYNMLKGRQRARVKEALELLNDEADLLQPSMNCPK